MNTHEAGGTAAEQASADPKHTNLDTSDRSYASRLWQYKQAETVALMINVGRRLDLFNHLSGAGAVSAAELAQASQLHERWVLEWLRLQCAAGIVDYVEDASGGDRFQLPDMGEKMLGDRGSNQFMLDNFEGGIDAAQLEGLIESFRTGIGKTYESAGPDGARRGEERHWRAARQQVIPKMIPALDGVNDKLAAGCRVADLGCGDGAVLLALAEAFPASTFVAYDPSQFAIARVKEVAAEMALDNVEAVIGGGEAMPAEPHYDLVITFDCIHDMTDPQEAISSIRTCLKDDGTWFIKDIRSKPKFKDNLRNPMLAMMYGFSLLSCMSSAMSEPGGAGLGTLGFNPEVAEKMSRTAGFTRFKMHDFKDPGNLYYEVRI